MIAARKSSFPEKRTNIRNDCKRILCELVQVLSVLLEIEPDISHEIASTFFGEKIDNSSDNEFDESVTDETRDHEMEAGYAVNLKNNSESGRQ